MHNYKITIIFAAIWSILMVNILMPSIASCLNSAQRESLVASLPRGEAFENDGRHYVWLPTLRGAKTLTGKTTSSAEATASDTANNQAIVEQKGPFTIYQLSDASGKSSATAISNSTFPIALNLQTQSLAVITGNIWLKLKDMNDAGAIAIDYGLTFSFSNAAMSTSFYQVPVNIDILTLRKLLQADSRIIRVTLDTVDRIRRPQ